MERKMKLAKILAAGTFALASLIGCSSTRPSSYIRRDELIPRMFGIRNPPNSEINNSKIDKDKNVSAKPLKDEVNYTCLELSKEYGFDIQVAERLKRLQDSKNLSGEDLREIILDAEFGDTSGVKNAYITNEKGDILFTLIRKSKILDERYVSENEMSDGVMIGDWGFPHGPIYTTYSFYYPLQNLPEKNLVEQYVLVVETKGLLGLGLFGKTKMDDHRSGIRIDKEIRKRVVKELKREEKEKKKEGKRLKREERILEKMRKKKKDDKELILEIPYLPESSEIEQEK